MFINCESVHFSYKTGTPVLDNISFALEKGKTLAIVGASGCGKSTLLRIISGILPSTNSNCLQGTILVENQTPDQYRQTGKLAFMFQEATLMPHLTVKENIELPLKIKGYNEPKKVSDLIEVVGLEEFANYLPSHLSGGMKTRVALSRAFATEPELLLLDEPFSALDIAWKSKLYMELEKLKESNETTVIIVTHDIQEALLLSDIVIVFNSNGTVLNNPIIIQSKLSIKERIQDISGFLSEVYTRYFIPIQDQIIKDGKRHNVSDNQALTILESLISIAGDLEKEKNFKRGSYIEIRKISHEKKVNEKLLNAYSKASTVLFKRELIWDILNYPDLPIQKHKELALFYIDHIDQFSKMTLNFFRVDSKDVFNFLKDRINDITIPNTKKWIYLCDMYASSENEKVIKYLEDVINGEIIQLNNSQAKEVAEIIKSMVKNAKQDSIHIA